MQGQMDKLKNTNEKFMKKSEREACWGARDKFWDCMKANKEDISKCTETRKGFEELCPLTWVTHFDRKFQFEKFKAEYFTKGFDKVDLENHRKKEEAKGQL